jgi:hypothetical protein
MKSDRQASINAKAAQAYSKALELDPNCEVSVIFI